MPPSSASSESSAESPSFHDPDVDPNTGSAEFNPDDVPVWVLVDHLLAVKRALEGTLSLVADAHNLATHARQMHEESVILSAQTSFLRRGISEQVRVLRSVRRGMNRAYDGGRREFKQLIRTLDAANGRLEQTFKMLRGAVVDPVFRPAGDAQKTLMDFVDSGDVEGLRDGLKESIKELQSAQTSFDGDLLRFDTDLRALNKIMSTAASPESSETYQSIPQLLASLTQHSHEMAEELASLTRHFDMCVKAVRTTEGGAALARRKAAEVTEGGDPVSISGVIAEQDADLDSIDPQERTELVQVVVQDAPEVDEVVSDIQAVLQQTEADFGSLKAQADQTRAAYTATLDAFKVLEDIGSRLESYVEAETEFVQRWGNEKEIVLERLEAMENLRAFYERYASAYGSLMLEMERRRSVQDKIAATWRKAKETVDKMVEADRKEREHFRQEIGEFLPTDLWSGMTGPIRRWEVVPVDEEAREAEGADAEVPEPTTPTLRKATPAVQ
ncbi:hypothetical protein OQA88_726 [Cercophora sp. LCS_1]